MTSDQRADDRDACLHPDPDDDPYIWGTPHDQRVTVNGETFYDEDYER